MKNKRRDKEKAKKSELEKSDKLYELQDRTIEALLLGFKKQIIPEYSIPSHSQIEKATGFAIRKFCGIDEEREKTFYGAVVGWQDLKHPEKLQEMVRKGLESVLNHPDREQMSPLGNYLIFYKVYTASEWFAGLGTLHRFRRGEKKKAEERIKSYFNEKEMQNFRQIHKIIGGYLARR